MNFDFSDLDALLDKLANINASADRQVAVSVDYGTGVLLVGLGPFGCFLQTTPSDGAERNWVSLADAAASGLVDYWFHGAHHSQIPRKYLISWQSALSAISDCVSTGCRSKGITCEEI